VATVARETALQHYELEWSAVRTSDRFREDSYFFCFSSVTDLILWIFPCRFGSCFEISGVSEARRKATDPNLSGRILFPVSHFLNSIFRAPAHGLVAFVPAQLSPAIVADANVLVRFMSGVIQ
jgi:hypothetical protein